MVEGVLLMDPIIKDLYKRILGGAVIVSCTQYNYSTYITVKEDLGFNLNAWSLAHFILAPGNARCNVEYVSDRDWVI